MPAPAPTPAFADPVLHSQRVFRAAMNALARPGTIEPLDAALAPPAPLAPELAALALTLADHEAPLWLDLSLADAAEARDYLRFHTGAPIVPQPADCAFALIADPARCPPLGAFAQGTPDYPDRSTTLLIQVRTLSPDGGLTLRGPGIDGAAQLRAEPLPPDFVGERAANRVLFPCGVDVLLVGPGRVAGLPRTTELGEG